MTTETENISKKKKNNKNGFPIHRIRFGIILTLLGFIIFLLGIRPGFFQMDRSPVIGFVQISVTLIGLAIICIGGYTSIRGLWKGRKPNLAADIGSRLMSTGYVIAVFAALADILGFGSHPYPQSIPYFGEWQAFGVEIAEVIIAIGLFMMIPFRNYPFIKK